MGLAKAQKALPVHKEVVRINTKIGGQEALVLLAECPEWSIRFARPCAVSGNVCTIAGRRLGHVHKDKADGGPPSYCP